MAAQPTPAHPAVMKAQLESTTKSADSPIPQPIVTTNRLIIRPMHPQDAHAMALNANNPLVSKYMTLGFPHPYTLSDADTWIDMNITKPQQTEFVICEKASPNAMIGGMGLRPGADVESHTAKLGFWVAEKYWGKGYTTEALEGLTKWVFLSRDAERKTTRLCGEVCSGNGASMRCFEKCGYAHEGVLKGHCEKYGEVMDLHLFGLTKRDWEERMAKASQ